ncbi:MAG: MBG domain-containing protein, partial [Ginsengibacter sp.]
MKQLLRSVLFTLFAVTLTSVHAFSQNATITTDLLDYPPGSTAIINGTGFQPGETVTLQVVHTDGDSLGTDPQYHQPFTAIANVNGNVSSSWFVPNDGDALGATLLLTADGVSSGRHAETTFTDAINFKDETLSAQTTTTTYGSSTTADFTYSFKVTGTGSGAQTYNISCTGLPVGVTYTPTSVTSSANNVSVTLNFTTGAATTGTTISVNVSIGIINGTATTSTLIIGKRSIMVTPNAGQNKTYGNADPIYTYGFSPALISGDAFAGTLTRDAGVNVGLYNITQGNLALSSNYTLSFVTGVKFAITQRPITITADPKTKVYGDADPALTAQVTSGTIQGTDASSGALSRVVGENVGSYAINKNTYTYGTNYNETYVSKDLTITQRPLSVTAVTDSKVYDGTATSSAPTVGSLATGDGVNVAPTQVYDNKNVGTTHVLSASGLTIKYGSNANTTGNYNISYVASPATGIISQKPLTVTAVTDSKVYDGTTTSSAPPTVGSLATGDAVNMAPTQVYDNKNVGITHVLTASGLTIKDGSNANTTGNYNISYVTNTTGEIKKITATVTAQTDTKNYDGNT